MIQDRWDKVAYKSRSMEDLKERYYGLVEKLETLHIDAAKISNKPFLYDADHERRRKHQLEKLYSRTPEQVQKRIKLWKFKPLDLQPLS